MSRDLDARLRRELEAVAGESGCELLDVDFRGGVLRLVLDREEGVTLGDCETVSRQVSALLDVTDFGPGKYLLEVSSPGLDRKLYGPRDYRRFQGRRVKVTWEDGEAAAKRTVVGLLESFEPEGGGHLEVVESVTAARHKIPVEAIRTARLEPEIWPTKE